MVWMPMGVYASPDKGHTTYVSVCAYNPTWYKAKGEIWSWICAIVCLCVWMSAWVNTRSHHAAAVSCVPAHLYGTSNHKPSNGWKVKEKWKESTTNKTTELPHHNIDAIVDGNNYEMYIMRNSCCSATQLQSTQHHRLVTTAGERYHVTLPPRSRSQQDLRKCKANFLSLTSVNHTYRRSRHTATTLLTEYFTGQLQGG